VSQNILPPYAFRRHSSNRQRLGILPCLQGAAADVAVGTANRSGAEVRPPAKSTGPTLRTVFDSPTPFNRPRIHAERLCPASRALRFHFSTSAASTRIAKPIFCMIVLSIRVAYCQDNSGTIVRKLSYSYNYDCFQEVPRVSPPASRGDPCNMHNNASSNIAR